MFESGRKCLFPGKKLDKTKRPKTKKIVKKPQKNLPFQCPKCPTQTRTQSGLNQHLSRIHGVKFSMSKWVIDKKIRERSLDPEKYSEKCLKCEFRSHSKAGIRRHMRIRHPEVIILRNDTLKHRKKGEHKSRFDKETLDWVEERTIHNILIQCNGNFKKLIKGQRHTLKDYGIITTNHNNYRLKFTQKGLDLLEEIQLEKT